MSDLYRERVRRQIVLPSPDLASPSGSPAFVGRVTTASPVVGKYILVHPVQVLGTESEGSSGSLAVDTGVSTPVLLIGPGVPAAGDDLLCRFVDHRWVAERKTTASGMTFCGCSNVPTTLFVTVAGQFQPASNGSYTLVWNATISRYVSTTTFTISGTSLYWIYYCLSDTTAPDGPGFYPVLQTWDGNIAHVPTAQFEYAHPNPGVNANTCSPYHMADQERGAPFPGATAVVTA